MLIHHYDHQDHQWWSMMIIKIIIFPIQTLAPQCRMLFRLRSGRFYWCDTENENHHLLALISFNIITNSKLKINFSIVCLIVVFWSQVSIPFWFCFLFVCLSYWKLSPSLNSSKIHDSVRSAYWSFVINVTSFQPFSLISILLLRLALSPTSHPIDYVYQMGALAGDGRTIQTDLFLSNFYCNFIWYN